MDRELKFVAEVPDAGGPCVFLGAVTVPGSATITIRKGFPILRAGEVLMAGGVPRYRVLGRTWHHVADGASCVPAYELEPMEGAQGLGGEMEFTARREGWALAWITLSDKGWAGERDDKSGPLIEEMAGQALPLRLARGYLIPDHAGALKALITRLALDHGFELILTTGGTGVGPRDITPEATMAVIEKRLPGFERAMAMAGLAKTPHAAISRAVAGTLGESVVLNMPGSPKAVRESLEAVLPAMGHTLDKLGGDPVDCATI